MTDTPTEVKPEMIAAAWGAWHARHGGKLGPGPAFVDAIKAALAASPPAPAAEPVVQYRARFRPVGGDWGEWEGWFDGVFPPEDHPQFETQTRTLYTHPIDAAAIRAEARRDAMDDAERIIRRHVRNTIDLRGAIEDIRALSGALADKGEAEGWRSLDDCPSDGSPIWLASFEEGQWWVTEREADGEWWRSMSTRRMWMPRQPAPAPPAGGRDGE
ncbi:hypothetical protein [Ancylobacter sp. IITR112]|uniref:hypothetical protein n=1 Tax=Ancylobacter sp. IITR112 TaxID=3138073 RepID=UPI00352BAB67